jgi:hypothetical protein
MATITRIFMAQFSISCPGGFTATFSHDRPGNKRSFPPTFWRDAIHESFSVDRAA